MTEMNSQPEEEQGTSIPPAPPIVSFPPPPPMGNFQPLMAPARPTAALVIGIVLLVFAGFSVISLISGIKSLAVPSTTLPISTGLMSCSVISNRSGCRYISPRVSA